MAQLVKNPPAMRETWVRSFGWEDPLEKGKAPLHYSGLENCMGCIVHGVTKIQTPLSDFDSLRLPRWLSGKEFTCQCRRHRRQGFDPSVGKIPWRRKWQPTSVFLPGESHGWKSLAGYSHWGYKESDMAEKLSTHILVYLDCCATDWVACKQ